MSTPHENDIQSWLDGLVAAGTLADKVEGRSRLEAILRSLRSDTFASAFPVDYLLRKQAVISAEFVLSLLSSAEAVCATRNVSLDRQESLLPDLLLFSAESPALLVVEIKRSTQTERQAVTELLGYEQEVRNHFPFLSQEDLAFVLVATDYSTLLEHSASALLMSGKRVLCLQLEFGTGLADQANWKLKVRIPSAWTSLGLPNFQRAFVTTTLCLYPLSSSAKPASATADTPEWLHTAFDLIVRQGEQIGSHGFALLWEDVPGQGYPPWMITIGVLNPFAFVASAAAAANTPITEFYRESDTLVYSVSDSLYSVAREARSFLKAFARPVHEAELEWSQWRIAHELRALPLSIDYWGLPGEFAREHVTSPTRQPAVQRARLEGLHWSNPVVGVPILLGLVSPPVSLGVFDCPTTFRLGVVLGAAQTLYHSMSVAPNKGLLPAIRWLDYELSLWLNDVGYRVGVALDLIQPPTLTLRSGWSADTTKIASAAKETQEELAAVIDWVQAEFLGSPHPIQQLFFSGGLRFHGRFWKPVRDLSDTEPAESEIAGWSEEVLRALFETWGTDLLDSGSEFLSHFLKEYLPDKDQAGTFVAQEAIEEIPTQTHVSLASSVLPKLGEMSTWPVFHAIRTPNPRDADWDWIRDQVAEFTKRLGRTGVRIGADGSISIERMELIPRRTIDTDAQVWLGVDKAGVFAVTLEEWNNLQKPEFWETFWLTEGAEQETLGEQEPGKPPATKASDPADEDPEELVIE